MKSIRNKPRGGVIFSLLALALALPLLAPLTAAPARAAGDHGEGPATINIAPRSEVRFDNQQLVVLYAGGRLFAFMEGFSDSRPTQGAVLEALVNFLPETLTEIAPGTYRSEPVSLSAGRTDIELSWRIGEQEGTVPVVLQIPGRLGSISALATMPAPKIPGWVFLLLAVALYVGIMMLFWRRARNRPRPGDDDSRAYGHGHGAHGHSPHAAE